MKDRILKHIEERESIKKELTKIIGGCNNSPFQDELNAKWRIVNDEVHIEVLGDSLDENYYSFTITSIGCRSEEFYMGTKDGITYIMGYADEWYDTVLLILDNNNRVD